MSNLPQMSAAVSAALNQRRRALREAERGATYSPPLLWWDLVCMAHGTQTAVRWTERRAQLEMAASRIRCGMCRRIGRVGIISVEPSDVGLTQPNKVIRHQGDFLLKPQGQLWKRGAA